MLRNGFLCFLVNYSIIATPFCFHTEEPIIKDVRGLSNGLSRVAAGNDNYMAPN